MHRTRFVCALGAILSLVSYAQLLAQPSKVEELRRQIQSLQQQLTDIEEDRSGSGRVTQIGATRLPGRVGGLVVRIYDLSDLFANAPTYEAKHSSDLKSDSRPLFERSVPVPGGTGGVGGFGGAGFFTVPSTVVRGSGPSPPALGQVLANDGGRTSMDTLIEAIQSTISPDDWVDTGGAASIAKLGNALLISAGENTHEQIEALFKLFRQRWGTLRTVSVQAWWLWLDDEELGQLIGGNGNAAGQPFGKVNEANFAKALGQANEVDDATQRGYRAALTCYNGQTVYTLSGGQSLAITQLLPTAIAGGDQKGGATRYIYQPQIAVIQEGAALQITPLVSTSGEIVVLDVHSRVCQRRPDAAKDQPDAEADNDAADAALGALERPNLVQQRLSTTLRIPAGQTMLIGGMTFDSLGEGVRPNLYLFARATVQELRDDEDEQPAEVEPKAKTEQE